MLSKTTHRETGYSDAVFASLLIMQITQKVYSNLEGKVGVGSAAAARYGGMGLSAQI
jgi:hypothetical protein